MDHHVQNGAKNGVLNGAHNGAAASHSNGMPLPKPKRFCRQGNGERWVVRASKESHDCVNPVRSCEEKYFKQAMESRDVSKSLIKLSIGMVEWGVGEELT